MKVKDLYKVDMLAFDSKIGYITNLGTTFYEMQSQYEVGSPEYEELSRRLKLCCINQNLQIDAAKGLKIKPFPRQWTSYQKINEEDSEEEKSRKEFENKLMIEKRPEFMRFLYPKYNREFKDFDSDFNLYSMIKFGKKVEEIRASDEKTEEEMSLLDYYDKKNPLLQTNGVMNRVCRYMQEQLKGINKKSRITPSAEIFDILYREDIQLNDEQMEQLIEKYHEYDEFKKTKQLKSSEFSTYEQYYKYVRNNCLETISSNIQELANAAVYICYKKFPNKAKDFCWDVFGVGIVENLKERKPYANIPVLDDNGEIEYLGQQYSIKETSVKNDEIETLVGQGEELGTFDFEDLFKDIELDFDDDIDS